MALEIREHIELHGDDPLAAMIAGTHYKAYLVANLAFNDGPQVTAEHYRRTRLERATTRICVVESISAWIQCATDQIARGQIPDRSCRRRW